MGSDCGKRRNVRGKLRASAGVRDGALGKLAVADGEGDADNLRLVGQVRPEPGEHVCAFLAAERAQPLVGLVRIAVGCCLQAEQPGGVASNAGGALLEHRLSDLARLASLPDVTCAGAPVDRARPPPWR